MKIFFDANVYVAEITDHKQHRVLACQAARASSRGRRPILTLFLR
jgi:hypothetical protein